MRAFEGFNGGIKQDCQTGVSNRNVWLPFLHLLLRIIFCIACCVSNLEMSKLSNAAGVGDECSIILFCIVCFIHVWLPCASVVLGSAAPSIKAMNNSVTGCVFVETALWWSRKGSGNQLS